MSFESYGNYFYDGTSWYKMVDHNGTKVLEKADYEEVLEGMAKEAEESG
ncbi:MAG TPA: hypothetical protein IAA51_02560 [Candidatus Cottocaccamicrobium excrementipullorum]|nr:hypothetical protein [Candidatus Cottocaccamicrobium excrementipullorum]